MCIESEETGNLCQDGSSHEWVRGKKWDLIVTMDDATHEHYSMFFVDEEGTVSSLLITAIAVRIRISGKYVS